MKVRFASAAIADIEVIRDYIAEESSEAASRVVSKIKHAIEFLRAFPRLGHVGLASGALELVVPGLPYVVVYELHIGSDDQVVILRVYHAGQDR